MNYKNELIKLSFAVIAFGVAVYISKLILSKSVGLFLYVIIGMTCFVLIKCGWYSLKTVWKEIFGRSTAPSPKEKVK